MEELNELEKVLLLAIIDYNKQKYSFLETHYPHLYVKNREFTVVGLYTMFEYKKDIICNDINDFIVSDKSLFVDGFECELTYELNITKGKIDFLEIVTNGDKDLFYKYEDIMNFKLE